MRFLTSLSTFWSVSVTRSVATGSAKPSRVLAQLHLQFILILTFLGLCRLEAVVISVPASLATLTRKSQMSCRLPPKTFESEAFGVYPLLKDLELYPLSPFKELFAVTFRPRGGEMLCLCDTTAGRSL